LKLHNLYYSTNLSSPDVSFREALLKGLAPDGGLYIPRQLPAFSKDELLSFSDKNYPEIAAQILGSLLHGEADLEDISEICHRIYDFEVPVESIDGKFKIMRLDRGPTASFKDFAALFMSRMMQYFLSLENQHIIILTATSGDTGSAVANAFHGMKNIRVIILFPSDEVTDLQRKQMTTLHNNIQVIAIDGKFDDCQDLVKKAFMDPLLSGMKLSSANSINIGRLLPQSVYYFWAWSRICTGKIEDIVLSVPSGNFGNLAGGLTAWQMGLPVKKFVVSTNENNEVPEYFRTGIYSPISPSRNCISSAMNVGHPSNLSRIVAMFGGIMNEKGYFRKVPDLKKMQEIMYAVSVSDDETRETIISCYSQTGTLLEPHGAVAWKGLEKFLESGPGFPTDEKLCCILETAHPVKFMDEIRKFADIGFVLPESINRAIRADEEYVSLENDYNAFRDFIIKYY
jgi:threonine synthase